jgi:2,5-diketo-D-gluconate reductase A
VCSFAAPTYDEAACRLSTWRALLALWKSGVARSVGVSNFNISHLMAIEAAGLPLPSVNQVSFSLYHSVAEMDLLAYCKAKGIQFNGWVPFARPDSWTQQPPCAASPVQDPVAAAIAAKYNATSTQLQLAWQASLGVALNPRSQNVLHMASNLDMSRLAALLARPQSICQPPACTNPVWTGCVNNGK